MVDVRKIIIIFVVAVLFSVFVFSMIDAFYPQPEYNDFCKDIPERPPMTPDVSNCEVLDIAEAEQSACNEKEGVIQYNYDSLGCATSYECNACRAEYDDARDEHNRYVFYISAIFALLAIFLGMYLPASTNPLNEWIGTGFLLGGAFALFFGTATSFNSLDRMIRPVIILLELVLVIFIAYRKIGNLKPDKK